MNRTIKCIRPAEYQYKLGNCDLYQSYDRVAQGLSDPGLSIDVLPGASELIDFAANAAVLSSAAVRAKQTAKLLSNNYKVEPLLSEIGYKMSEIIASQKFGQLTDRDATTLARKRFFESLYANRLQESHHQLIDRTLFLLYALQGANRDVLVVGHGFFLKFLEVVVNEPAAAFNYELFRSHYDGSKMTYAFLEGPSFSSEQLKKAATEIRNKK